MRLLLERPYIVCNLESSIRRSLYPSLNIFQAIRDVENHEKWSINLQIRIIPFQRLPYAIHLCILANDLNCETPQN